MLAFREVDHDIRSLLLAINILKAGLDSDESMLKKYVALMRTRVAPQTLYRRCMAIRHAHLAQDVPSPTSDSTLRPILRALQLGRVLGKDLSIETGSSKTARSTPKPSAPLTRRLLSQMLEHMHRNSKDRRDAALLLLGDRKSVV